MNTKNDKIELIKAIAAGEIDPAQLSSESIVISVENEVWVGLLTSVTCRKAGRPNPVIYVGRAKESFAKISPDLLEKVTARRMNTLSD